MLRKVLLALAVLGVLLALPGLAFVVRAQGQQAAAPMFDLSAVNNVGLIIAFVLYVIVREVQAYQRDKQHFNLVTSLTEALTAGTDNTVTMAAIAGARDNIPPTFVTDFLAALQAARVIAPFTIPLDDELAKLAGQKPPAGDTPPVGQSSAPAVPPGQNG